MEECSKKDCGERMKIMVKEILFQMECVKKYSSSIHATTICVLGHTEQNLAYSVRYLTRMSVRITLGYLMLGTGLCTVSVSTSSQCH